MPEGGEGRDPMADSPHRWGVLSDLVDRSPTKKKGGRRMTQAGAAAVVIGLEESLRNGVLTMPMILKMLGY